MPRNTLKIIGLILFLSPLCCNAVSLKIATAAPDGTAWMKEMRASSKRIASRTEDRVKLKFYPGGVMGSSNTVMRKMRVGQLHGGAFTGGELADTYPDFLLYSLPFLFRGEEEVQFVRSRLDQKLADGLEERGMVLLGLSGGGFVYLMSDHPVEKLSTLAGSKVWVPEGDSISEMALRLCGVAPIPVPLSDVYTALQTGVIDTVVNTPVGAIAFQWHTRTRFVLDFPIAYVVGAMAVDSRAFAKLSAEDQLVVREEVAATFANLDRLNLRDNIDARGALMNHGITYLSLAPEQLPIWRQVGVDTLEKLHASDMELEHLELVEDAIREYRSTHAVGTE
jgi:TRAP-type C4-dicarboxylate transport system substrate-binding protein